MYFTYIYRIVFVHIYMRSTFSFSLFSNYVDVQGKVENIFISVISLALQHDSLSYDFSPVFPFILSSSFLSARG